MTLAHSVSCKSAEQSPQERKSCQASILTMKGCGRWKEANQTQQWPDLLWPQWACEDRATGQVTAVLFRQARMRHSVQWGGWQHFPSYSLRKGAKLDRPSKTELGTKTAFFYFSFYLTLHSQPYCLQSQKSPFLTTSEQRPDNSLDDLCPFR